MKLRELFAAAFGICLLTVFSGVALAQEPQPAAIVSAASFRGTVSPDSLASIFGTDFADAQFNAELDGDGELPTVLGGISVEIDGTLARLIFVSPTQINFVVPESLDLGTARVRVLHAVPAVKGGDSDLRADVQLTAPGIFAIRCLRGDQAAVLNGVTFRTGPFRATTPENQIEDKRTRLAIFATGIRFAGNPEREIGVNVASSLTLEAIDAAGNVYELELEYGGPAPNFKGLDQLNAVLTAELDGLGILWLRIKDGERVSNLASVVLSSDGLDDPSLAPTYQIDTVAGAGIAGHTGDGAAAVAAQLKTPLAVAHDRFLNLFVADSANGVVRRIDAASGIITTVAGTVGKGASGDGGFASAANLERPTGVALDALGNLYIADADDHRVRRVDPVSGIITTYAGTGVSGFSGDGAAANAAEVSSPTAIALNPQGSLVIADTGNNRLRMVTGDGQIQTIAGSGSAGFSGDKGPATDAQLDAPDSVVVTRDGTIFVGDGGNKRIRRIDSDGWISTVAGGGASKGFGGTPPLEPPFRIAVGPWGRVLIGDSVGHHVHLMDSVCALHTVAGTGEPGFSGDGGPALSAQLYMPMGLTVDPVGDVFVADSGNHRVRKLWSRFGDGECGEVVDIVIVPTSIVGGQSPTGYVRLSCPVESDTTVTLTSDDPSATVPPTVVVPAGETTVAFDIITAPPQVRVIVTITGTTGDSTGTGTLTVSPPSEEQTVTVTLSENSVEGGESTTGRVTLGIPAPAGGVDIELSTDDAAAEVAASVRVPEGQTVAEFLVVTQPVTSVTPVVVTGALGEARDGASLLVLPEGDNDLSEIESLTLDPSTITGGGDVEGKITLTEAAPEGGAVVVLSSSNSSADVPSQVTIPEGQTMVTFDVTTSTVPDSKTVSITATAGNSVSADLRIQAGDDEGPGEGTIEDLSITPSTVEGGDSATGTVTLSEPAPEGGVRVNLSSDENAADVPSSIIIPEGATERTFTVSTSVVGSETDATITATSANSASDTLTIEPSEGGPVEGTIKSVEVSPSTVEGGSSATGTVTLAEPAPEGGVLVDLSSDEGAANVPSSITIPEGETEGTFNVSTTSVESETVATITAESANSASDTLTIQPDDGGGPGEGTIQSLSVTPGAVDGGATATGTVTLADPAPEGGVLVDLSSDEGAANVPSSITIPEGETEGTFDVETSPVSEDTVATITATSANSATDMLTIKAPCVDTLTLTVDSVVGRESVTATVTLTSPAPEGGSEVTLVSSDAAVSVPSTVTVLAGETSAQFQVTTASVAALVEATIEALLGDCPGITVDLEVKAPVLESLGLSPSTVALLGTVTGTVTVDGPAPAGGLEIELDSDFDLPMGNTLNLTMPTSVTIEEGETSVDFDITTAGTLLQTVMGNINASLDGEVKSAVLTVNPAPAP